VEEIGPFNKGANRDVHAARFDGLNVSRRDPEPIGGLLLGQSALGTQLSDPAPNAAEGGLGSKAH
jgi:hypothetical protein